MAKGIKAAKTVNPYEKERMQRIEECRTRLLDSGILHISRSLTNLVDNKANKKRKKKAKGSGEGKKDPDYDPDNQSATEEDQEDEGQSSNQAKSTKKLKKNADHLQQHQDEGSATEVVREHVGERSTEMVKKPVTRSTAPSQKFVPPMMLNKLLKQSKQKKQAKGKAPTVAELILQKKQSEKEAAVKSLTPNQLVTDADLQWLSELDERFHVNGDQEDRGDGLGNPVNDNESASEGNGEDLSDNDNDKLDDSDNEDLDDTDDAYAEDANGNELEQRNSEMVMQGATGRGPTMMHAVHMRPADKREVIMLNEFGQPIGPVTSEKDTAKEFSRFLGTIARNYDNAPLTYKTWRKVPHKDKLWEYVLGMKLFEIRIGSILSCI